MSKTSDIFDLHVTKEHTMSFILKYFITLSLVLIEFLMVLSDNDKALMVQDAALLQKWLGTYKWYNKYRIFLLQGLENYLRISCKHWIWCIRLPNIFLWNDFRLHEKKEPQIS